MFPKSDTLQAHCKSVNDSRRKSGIVYSFPCPASPDGVPSPVIDVYILAMRTAPSNRSGTHHRGWPGLQKRHIHYTRQAGIDVDRHPPGTQSL